MPGDAAVAATPDARPKKLFITGAGRCGECHEKMYDEWETSAHANAASSPLYKLAVADAKDKACDRCHAPLLQLAPKDIVGTEGITCDVCHTLRDPAPGKDGGHFTLAVDDMIKYGPRCDLEDHYFHRMGCSPEHSEARICGACHLWEPGGLPVLTEYADWKAGPLAAKGTQCQDCHMPDERAVIATGSPVRKGVPHHGLLGIANDLRRRALELEVTVSHDDDKLAAALTLRNKNAGHAVPAGLPERRVVVRVRLVDKSGTELASETRVLGRKLVDAAGVEAPFWHAARLDSDTRIQPGGEWTDTIALPSANAGKVEVDVVYRGMTETIAKRIGTTEIEEHPMVRATVKLAGTRPRTVTVRPPPAGRRAKKK